MHDMIAVLDAFVYPGSELWLYNEARPLIPTGLGHHCMHHLAHVRLQLKEQAQLVAASAILRATVPVVLAKGKPAHSLGASLAGVPGAKFCVRCTCMQVPVQEREKILKKEGLDPSRLTNLQLVYKVQEVRAMIWVTPVSFKWLTVRLSHARGGWHANRTMPTAAWCLRRSDKGCSSF